MLTMKVRSKTYTENRIFRLLPLIIMGGVMLFCSSSVWGQSGVRHYGGKNDGYTKGCVPPVIQSVKKLKNGGCVEDGNLYIAVMATGTNVSYQWQKQNPNTHLFEAYVPQEGTKVEGIDGPKLSFLQTTELDNGYYRCVLSNECSDEVVSDTLWVDISSKPAIKSGLFDRNVCVGEKVMYNIVADAQGNPEYTYQWYKNGSAISGATQSFYTFNAAATKKTTDTYVVKVTNKCGSVKDTSRLTISTLPLIESFTDTVWACRDSSATLSVKVKEGGDYTYELYGVAYPSLTETLVWMGVVNSYTLKNIAASGVYRWKVSNDCGTVSGDLMYVKVEDSPVIALHPQSDTVCEGSTVLLSCSVVPAVSQPLTYVWYKDGVPGSKSSQNYLRLRNITVANAGAYRCEVYNSCPSVKTEVANIGVLQKPLILIQPAVQGYYCEGDSVSLGVILDEARGADSVRWYYGDTPLTDNVHTEGSASLTLKIRGLKAADVVRNYQVRVYNQCGEVWSTAVKLNLHYPARFVRNASDDVELILCGGDEQTLYVSATGSDTIRYTWTFNGRIVADGYSNRLTVKGENLDASGEYVCQVQNSCGNDKVVSYVKQSLPPLSDFQGGGHYCAGETGIEACLSNPKLHTTYQLYKKGNNGKGMAVSGMTAGDTVSGPVCYDNLLKGTYYVVARDTNSCERVMNGEVISVEDSLPLNYKLKVAREICEGEPDGDLMLEKSQNGIAYYLCRKSNSGWDTLATPYYGTGEALYLNHIGPGQYKVIGYNPATGCRGELTTVVTLTERPLPELYNLYFRNNDSVYCANLQSNVILQYSQWTSGYKYQLKNDGANYGPVLTGSSLSWKNVPAGHYILQVTNSWGCHQETPEKEVKAQQPPVAYALQSEPYFCAGIPDKQITLTGSAPDYTYQLRSLDGQVKIDTVGTGTAIVMNVPVASGSYYVIATDNTPEHCRSLSDTLTLRRSDIKAQSRTLSADYGTTVNLEVAVTGYIGSEDKLQYHWDNPDKLTGNDSEKSPETTVITESRLYTVIVTDSVGCSDTATVLVRCYGGKLVGEIRLSDCMTDAGDTLTVCLGESIGFCGMVSGGFENRGFTYSWWDVSGELTTASSLTGYAPETGRYLYWKVVNGTDEVTDSVWINVHELRYPGDLPVLHKTGMACGDSTLILSLNEKKAGLIYTLKKNGVAYGSPVEAGDSLKWMLTPAEPGRYTVEISDGSCKLVLSDTIKVHTTPARVNLEGDSLYCEGTSAVIAVKNAETEADYWLYDQATGNRLIKGVRSGRDILFSGRTTGTYYVEAVAGECITRGGSLTIREVALPDASLNVGFDTAGMACAGFANRIKVEATESGKKYILCRKGKTDEVDSFYGDGSDRKFGPVTTSGIYVVYAKDTLSGCEVLLPQTLTVENSPAAPLVASCAYCAAPAAVGCGIQLNYKAGGVYYYLSDGSGVQDTLTMAGGYRFKPQKKGRYQITAVDSLTGCPSLPVEVGIEEVASPKILAVNGGCILQGNAGTISTLTAGEGDTIRYILYKNGTATDKTVTGSGNTISFSLSETGVYRIWAENSLGCGVFMEDSVTVYPDLQISGDSLYTEGIYCGAQGGVKLSYPVSTALWKYYITDGSHYSDTLTGNGLRLVYNQIAGQPVHPGRYTLYAMSPCGTDARIIATATVADHQLPLVQSIDTDTALLCAGESVDIRLNGSENAVGYEVWYYNLSGDYVRTYPAVAGSGSALTIGSFSATGIYKVYADNGCRLLMDSMVMVGGRLPQVKSLLGEETCVTPGNTAEIHLSVSGREESVAYYLYKDNNVLVDSLTSVYRPDTADFAVQTGIGCYQVVAVHEKSGCRKPAEGIRCIGSISQTFALLPDAGDTVRICNKSKYCLSLAGSEKGVNYTLYRNHTDSLFTLAGTGSRLDYACVDKQGSYRIKAKVAACELWMEDSVYVEVMERPSLTLNDTFRYCEGEAGVHIRLGASEPTLTYTLYTPDGRQETRSGAAYGGPVEFTDVSNLQGYYYVEAYDPLAGCQAKDSTVVIKQSLPLAFDLTSAQGHYICVDGNVTLTLAGSEKGTEYGLFRTDRAEAVVTRQGTGAALQFTKIKDPGVYYIVATALSGERCENDFGSYELKQADTVRIHNLLDIKGNYCYTDEEKGKVGLDGSHAGVDYELWRDGASTGLILSGTGDTLIWTKVEGKACAGVPGEMNTGYKYSVLARDTLSGCKAYMRGLDTVIESGNVVVWTYQPNEAVEKCEGEQVNFNVLTSGCGQYYTWYHEDTVISQGRRNYFNIDSVKTASAGTYYCRVSNSCSEARTPEIELTVRKAVKIEKPMEEVWACVEGENVMISSGFVHANGYYWYKEGAPEKCLSTRDYLMLADFRKPMAGKYICKAGGSALDCNVVYDTCEVVYGEYPAITGEALTDTVCVGSVWQTAVVNVNNFVSMVWKHNEDTLNFSGQCYTVAPVGVADAGNYTVEATNKCGTKTQLIGKLYVDQPLTVDTVSPSLALGCIGEAKELFIRVSPANGQEKYEWYLNGKVVGRNSSYRIPAYTRGGTYAYQVWYTNKCTSGTAYKEISVHVPEKLEFIEPERNVSVCAGDQPSTTLKVTIDPSLMANFKWYFQKSEETTERVLLEGTADSYTVPLTRANSGYYYCEVYNECESKTTQTTWVKVDTVPTLQTALVNDTACAGSDYTVAIQADGGSLTYTWQIKKRNDMAVEEIKVPLKNELVLRNISAEYDSCLIWCDAENSCGKVTSNTMLLRVGGGNARLKAVPEALNTCDTTVHKVAIVLEGGRAPWSYKYLTPSEVEKEVTVSSGSIDSLDVSERGFYRIIAFKDAMGCTSTENLPEVDANIYDAALVTISGGGEKCQGDTASLHIHIEQGHGPWELTLARQSGGYATDVADAYPIRITARDTTLVFYPEKSEEYYIYQTVKDLGSDCPAQANADRVKLVVHEVGHIDFRTGWPAHVGKCVTDMNLRTVLQPSQDGVALSQGDFLVDGVSLNGDHWLMNDLAVGCYPIQYQYTDTVGCVVSSDEIRICIDDYPSGEIESSQIACGSVASYFDLRVKPAARVDSVVLRISRYKKWDAEHNPKVKPKYSVLGMGGNELTGGLLHLPLTWDNVGSPDSCIVIEVLDIIDRDGCHMKVESNELYKQNYCDTVWWHADPEVAIQVRRSGETEWKSGLNEISIAEGDSVAVKVTLIKGMPVWSLPTLGVGPVASGDTVLWLKNEGVYSFRAQDDYCGRMASVWPELEVNFRDTGYFSGRLWLEGPFDPDNEMMYSAISGKLGLPAPGSLPLLPPGLEVIDWIQVELRVGPHADSVALLAKPAYRLTVDSCLLLSDGSLADRYTGDVRVGIRQACDGGANNRYVVVRHRNHLGIMSRQPVHFMRKGEAGVIAEIDFTYAPNIYCRDGRLQDHVSYVTGVGWLMSGGELNKNFLITLFDPNGIALENIDASSSAMKQYDVLHDINFDGTVDWPGWNGKTGEADWNIVRRNRQKFTEIEWK